MTLIIGIGLAQLVPVLLQPVLRRMFAPEEFGVFAVYFSIVSTFAIIANFRYASVIVIPEDDETAKNVLAGALLLIASMSCLLFVVGLLFGESIITYFEFPNELMDWVYVIPISVFFVSGSLVLNSWLTRKKKFRGMASNKMIRRGAEGASQLSFGWFKVQGGVIMGTIIGDITNFFVSFWQFKNASGSLKGIKFKAVFDALKRYKDFPLYNLIPTLLDTLSLFIPVMIISNFYTDEITGQFDLSRQILALPLALISAALSQVLLQNIAQRSKERKYILPLLRKNFIGLGLMGVIGVLILFPLSVPIFTFVFGEQWEMSGKLTSVLVFSYAMRFAITPLSITFIAIEKIRISSFWQVMYFGAICILFTFDNLTIYEFINYYVIIEISVYFLYAILIYLTAKTHDKKIKREISS
ncbi:MAG: oligosaccharide flippase family protein [Crocinitomicaceae bacterium]|nr:oligosaccharide flippase family protein [Crocinitomicaceae bacterium]